jgi:hypothetical protein
MFGWVHKAIRKLASKHPFVPQGRERKREAACKRPADILQPCHGTGGQGALTAEEGAAPTRPGQESPREARRGRTHAWGSLGGSSLG